MFSFQVAPKLILIEEVAEEGKKQKEGTNRPKLPEILRNHLPSHLSNMTRIMLHKNSSYARSRQANTPILKEAVAVMKEIQAKANHKNMVQYSSNMLLIK